MPLSAARTVRRYLAGVSSPAAAGDAALLARHLAGDHEAFAELVRRHGPMVLGVCRRALGPTPDADDAFQAVFLALARHARRVRRRDDLGAWLHRVAVHAAARARARRARAEPGELPDVPGPPADPLADLSWREVRRLLDEELDRLPARLRGPLVACYLDGQTRDEAARRLGCSVSTLKRRLRRGLHVLRARLAGRGIAPVALGAAALGGDGLRAVVPEALQRRTAQIATGATANIPGPPLELVPDVVRAGLRAPAAAIAALTAGVVAVVCLSPPTRADRPPPANPSVAAAPHRPPADTGENDPLPAGAAARFGSPRFRTGAVTRAQVSPDGKLLAVPSPGGLLVWDLASGRHLARLPFTWRDDQNPNLDRFCFTGDGTLLAAVDRTELRVYSIDGTTLAPKSWIDLGRHGGHSIGLPSGRTLDGIAPGDGFGMRRAVLVRTDGYKSHVADLDRGILSAPSWRTPPGQGPAWLLLEPGTFVVKDKRKVLVQPRVWLSPSGRRGVVVDESGYRLFGADAGLVAPLPGPPVKPADIAGAVTDTALYVGQSGGGIGRIDLDTQRPRGQLPGHPVGSVSSLAVTRDGKTLVSLGTDHVIRRWDLATRSEIPPPDGYTGRLRAAFSPDGRSVAVGDSAGRVDVWDADTRTGRRLRTRGPEVRAVRWLPDGRSVAAFVDSDTLVAWDARTGGELRSVVLHGRAAPAPPDHWFPGVALSPDGTRAARVLEHGGTWVYDAGTGRPLWSHPRTGDAAFSPDGRTLAVGRPSEGFHLLDAATGRVLRTVLVPPRVTRAADRHPWTFAPDGRTLVVAADQPNAQERGLRPARGVAVVPVGSWQTGVVTALSPDGRWQARGDETGAVTLIETASGKPAREAGAHLGPVAELAFRPDGRRLLSVGRDLTVLLWDLRVPVAASSETTDQVWERARFGPDFFPALYALADRPDAVDLLRAKFRPAVGPPPEEIARALFHLDSDRYAVREPAFKRLSEWGPLAEPAMRHTLTRGWSADTIRRLETILDTLPRPLTEEEVAQTRAVFVLETMNTPAARQLLDEWATGADGARLTEEARKALKRLDAR